VVAVKMEGCPVCNEPIAKMRLRSDYTPPIQFVVPLCIPGSVSPGDATEIVLERNYKRDEQEYEAKFPALPHPETPVESKENE
jgi:hypothetical protein